mgnify:CR=1 FL=1
MSNLFQSIDFKSHSGLDLSWKIECDALQDGEWFTLSKMIMELSPPFSKAVGIPRGGVKLGNLLKQYGTKKKEDPICIVDDVLTTGGSMIEYAETEFKGEDVIGWTVFARGQMPEWVNALFRMPYIDENGDLIKMIGIRD